MNGNTESSMSKADSKKQYNYICLCVIQMDCLCKFP